MKGQQGSQNKHKLTKQTKPGNHEQKQDTTKQMLSETKARQYSIRYNI
jgi:hypothetical protein